MAFTISFSPTSREKRWVDQINKKFIKKVTIDISEENPICIFRVPNSISIFKPEAYLPQVIALGPYHHMDPHLYDMERYKVASAKWLFNQTSHLQGNIEFRELLIDKIKELDLVVRGCYHSYLEFNDNTLCWIMAIDGLFLLNILQDHFVNLEHNKMAPGSILSRDLILLENQIPFAILKEISKTLKYNSSEKDDDEAELLSMMEHFCHANSPLKVASISSCHNHAGSHYMHLLDLMYQLIVSNGCSDTQRALADEEKVESQDDSEETEVTIEDDMNSVCDNIGVITKIAMKLGIGRKILKPFQVIQDMPWDKLLSIIPGLNTIKKPDKHEGDPIVQEIKIPSVSSLHYYAGIAFRSTNGGIRDIKFVEEEATLYLPVITLDIHSEAVLRNLVAYETAMNYSNNNPSISHFLDLISGIIDNAEDAKLLKQKGIIRGDLTNDQIAEVFNGMNKATDNSGSMVVVNINKYYKKRFVVKIFKFIKRRFFALWKVIARLLTVLLLLLLVLYLFCQFYGCPKIFGSSS